MNQFLDYEVTKRNHLAAQEREQAPIARAAEWEYQPAYDELAPSKSGAYVVLLAVLLVAVLFSTW